MDQLSAKPDGTPSPQVRIAFLDMLRLWLFFAIPIYARAHLSTSLLVVTCHFPLMGACALCLARFNGKDRIGLIWDVAYGLLASILPFWAHSVCRIFWFGPDFNSWRLDVLYWMFVLRKLVYLLPEQYGSDVELLIPEYEQASHPFSRLGTEMAATFVGWVLWPRGCPWYHVLLIFSIVRSVLEYLQFAYMNHTIVSSRLARGHAYGHECAATADFFADFAQRAARRRSGIRACCAGPLVGCQGEEDGAAGLDEGWGGNGVGFEGHGGWMFGVVEMVEEVVVVEV
ncbi:hypothetical protein HBI38_085780 [Parastagonospora nodorum]|nr:hypothetical protein HBI73_192020 [Parastagonospora nodorum]KAH5095227.1 hypothetical protein HBH72_151850 [Parastagonospora nodorum]KAH5536907.1 hypothetical protein HBI27_149680 [Parastagonospora nodorum]KAH5712816.1 hypothetical protein HBI20_161950 [Parastagonospora nodorum]KAH6084260.1 hypothetical protein HBI65_200290 [Parastagonospora nodorum]